MKTACIAGLSALLTAGPWVGCALAQSPRNVSVTFNGETDAAVQQQLETALRAAGLTDFTVVIRELEVTIVVRK